MTPTIAVGVIIALVVVGIVIAIIKASSSRGSAVGRGQLDAQAARAALNAAAHDARVAMIRITAQYLADDQPTGWARHRADH